MNTREQLGDWATFAKLVDRSIEEFYDDRLKNLKISAFRGCTSLKKVVLPLVTELVTNSFGGCTSLESIDLSSLNKFNTSLPSAKLVRVILRNESIVATLTLSNAFSNAPNAIIYVPDSLVEDYKSATNWSAIADRIKPLSELPPEEEES